MLDARGLMIETASFVATPATSAGSVERFKRSKRGLRFVQALVHDRCVELPATLRGRLLL